jgi:ABC-2 type transport system permease protein
MRDQVASEWRKIRTTRTAWGLLGGLVGLIMLGSIGTLTHSSSSDLARSLTSLDVLGVPMFSLTIFALVLGLRSFTDEFRHGSIVPTLLADPNRRRVLAGKLVVMVGMGIVFAVAAGATGIAITLAYLSIKGLAVHVTPGAIAAWSAELVAIGALWAALGVGVGLAVKHQVAAIVGSLVWIMVGEQLLGALVPKFAKYLPGTAAEAIHDLGPNLLSHIVGGVVLGAWMVLAVVVGAVLMQRRDIT